MLHGFLNIDKPVALTSHDVVARVRRLTGQKRVGHGGTLDPAASGVLPVGLGEATRLLEFLVDGRKRYRAVVELGRTTTTDDAEGDVMAVHPVPDLDEAALRAVLRAFTGTIAQVPPMYSALSVGGKRLYELARQGVTLDLEPRPVEIDRIDLVCWESPRLTIDVVCGKGTYIRALARDLGQELGCGAHLCGLRRTAVGPLTLATALPLPATDADRADLLDHLLPPQAAVEHLTAFAVDPVDAQRIRNGLPLALPLAGGVLAQAHEGDTLLALLRYDGAVWHPFKVFAWR